LSVKDLRVHFALPGGRAVRAVDGVSLELFPGETVALVGESGCGKSTLARAIMGIAPIHSGNVLLRGDGEPPIDLHREYRSTANRRRRVRRRLQMIFQDPDASLNPRMTLGAAIGEPLQIHTTLPRSAQRARVSELLEQVGLSPEMANRYPHELSGGQRQRVCIARALAVAPDLLVCDEATSALDVSVQAQILNLLGELRREYALSYLFITHDLAVVRQLADRVMVMYLGQLVEVGETASVLESPAHPYTRALLASVPRIRSAEGHARASDTATRRLTADIPSPANPPSGCRFHTRCQFAQAACEQNVPELRALEPTLSQAPIRLVRCPYAPNFQGAPAEPA
jgi:oligopeptide/dipeptide ABC transporter ATP-binding protein